MEELCLSHSHASRQAQQTPHSHTKSGRQDKATGLGLRYTGSGYTEAAGQDLDEAVITQTYQDTSSYLKQGGIA